jgi:hypothetical protein
MKGGRGWGVSIGGDGGGITSTRKTSHVQVQFEEAECASKVLNQGADWHHFHLSPKSARHSRGKGQQKGQIDSPTDVSA